MSDIESELAALAASGNLRRMPAEAAPEVIDLSSNDYLGLGADVALRQEFFARHRPEDCLMTSSASRLLSAVQRPYAAFESELAQSYGHGLEALLFNSGYHANTGVLAALAGRDTLIVADRLVHASIIDGARLSGARMLRWRHNDIDHLTRIMAQEAPRVRDIIIVAESVYSMDGDRAPLRELCAVKRRYPGSRLYIDEAHAVGAAGPAGLGLTAAEGLLDSVDILVGTLGKALASAGAFVMARQSVKQYLINKARALIFSTALPPLQAEWSRWMWQNSLTSDWRRERLDSLSRRLAEIIPDGEPSYIRPLIVGSAKGATDLSATLLNDGIKVLPIRTPTVPAGTERLRFSLSAALTDADLAKLQTVLSHAMPIH